MYSAQRMVSAGILLCVIGCSSGAKEVMPIDTASGTDTASPDEIDTGIDSPTETGLDTDTPTDTGSDTDSAVDSSGDSAMVSDTASPVFPYSVPPFSLMDVNIHSASGGQSVSTTDYLKQVSGWYFTHAT